MDARSLFLTPDTTTVRGFACLDLTDGPVVLTMPSGVLGSVDDATFRRVNDVGLTGPDAGQGGSCLDVPPGDTGTIPTEGRFVQRPATNTRLLFFRAVGRDGDVKAAVDGMKAILTEAAAVGDVTARTLLVAPRDPAVCVCPDRTWLTPFVGGSSEVLDGAQRLLDARTMFFTHATGITPAMAAAKPGSGSA